MRAPAIRSPAVAPAAPGPCRRRRLRWAAVALGVLAADAGRAAAAPADDARLLREQRAVFKRLEAELILEPARREWSERRELRRELRRHGVRQVPADTLLRPLRRRPAALAMPGDPAA